MVLANHERWRCECARRAWLRRAMACAMVVLLCAVHGVGAADVSDADAVEARGTGAVDGGRSTRARRGVDAALDALQTQRSTVLEFIDDVATCEQTFFIVDVSRGARVTVTAQDGRDMGKTWTFHESGSKHASCLEPGETQNLGITTEPGDDEGKSVSFRVENQHGDVLMMRDEDLKVRAQTRYSSMTLPAKSKRVSKLGKKLGPCVDVVVGTAFSSNAGAKRQINHAIFTSDGTLVSEWTKHASGEKRMCLLEGRSYSLRVNGAATYGTVDDRLAVRVTRADGDPKDGYAYLLVRSEALFDEANHVYAAAQDETRDNMKLNGDFEFHIPKTCDIDEAELSVVVQTSTHGDGVPPHGMGWTMHDTDDKQVLTMTTPFKPSEYGVARMHSACVKNGMYKFNAIASDERGWNYGPKLGIYRRWNGEDRQLLVTLGADETVMKRVVSRPWFDQSLVSETVPVNIDRSSEQPSALGVDMQVPHGRKAIAVAALGDAQDATRRSAIGFNTASLVFACIAVYAFVAMYEGVGTIDVESKRSLVGEESVSAYGAGRAGVLDEEVASTSSPSRRKRASFEDVKFRAIAIGSSMLAIATSRHAMHVSTASLGQSQTYVKGAMCGMGVTNCKKLYAPDCQSRYMFTYRQGKLAHRPKHMLPYQSQVEKIPGKTVKVDVKFDPETCAVKAETCKDLGEFKGSVASLSKCFDKCRETENCKTFSVKSRSCHLCSSADIEPCESGECDAVASRANCMNKFKFSFVGASPEACAKVCEETMQCHAFNYFNRTATDPSHCALLRLPLGYEAHVWRESAKTSAGIDGAATYYKAPSDRQCEARDEQVAALALPEGLIEEKRRVDAALAEMNGADPLGYPDEDGYPYDDDSTSPWESTVPPSQEPESTTPESTTPESTVPSYPHDDDSTLPWESTTPESTTPESTVPSQGPESTTPESTTPESPTPESTIPSTYPSTVPESTTPPKREWHVTDKMVVTGYVFNTFGFQQSNAFTESMAQLFNIPDSTVAVVKLEAPAVEDNIIDVLVHFDITAEDESQANDISQTLKSMTDAKFTKNTQLVDIMNLMGCTKTSTVYVGDVPLVEEREEAVETIPTNATAWTREVFTQVEVKSDYTVETFDAQAQASFRQVMGQLLHVSPTDIRFTTIETVSASHRRLLATSSTLSFYVTVRVSTDAQAQEVIDVLNGWNDALAVDLQNAGLPVETTQTVLDPVVQVYSPSSDSAYPSSDAPSDSTSGDSSAPSVAPAPTPVPSSTSPGADADAAKTYNINVNVDVVINTNGVPFYDGCTGADCADAQDSTAPVEPASSSSSSSSSPFYPASTSSSTPPSPVDESSSDCVNPGSKTNFNLYDELGSLENTALQAAQAFAAENGLKVPDADAWVRPKICNLPHMKCCANLPDWRRDNQIRFPFVCGSAPVGCHTHTYDESKAKCVAEGGYLCRGNAVSTSMKDPTCPGTKTDFAWTLTRCDVNGVEGRVIRPSAGGAPGAMCETNLKARHQTRCCSNVC